ncbi:unnamed protein product [Miscanthus lutarioriparius]|uniref:Uncharacterized protein n=1 Tax=Miscanthus lutarioriparius TaxID=422564 RepID=A0A811Q3F5_9POAL|nr:unnamed protein product [Miscanthus lutarioriparius]
MEKRKRVLELRDRLDRTLAMPDLAEEASLRALVKKQILASSLSGSDQGDIDLIAETRAREVSEFLEMLNTSRDGLSSKVRGVPQKEWKVKQDTDQLRVMYREGPDGTPFHTLLAEGFADGPIDVCTCVSWESALYKKWFPQYNLPTFRIDQSGCLKKVRIGEEICMVRVKVPWPVSEREALLHYFELEYLKEDVVIVIMKTLSDLDGIDVRTHGFSRDGIPEAGDTVRIDVFGGLCIAKDYKRKKLFSANMDIKLDFVPPWLINFISRQLIGSGHKLYQKAVSTVATHDDDYRKALRGPLYVRIREYQDSDDKAKVTAAEENATEVPPANATIQNHLSLTNTISNSEIVEEETEQNTSINVDNLPTSHPYEPVEQAQQVENKPYISPEVERALCILDSAIAVLKGDKAGNVTTLQNLLSYDATLEESTAGLRTSQTNILNADNLLIDHPITTVPQDSRDTRQAHSLASEKISNSAEDAIDKNSLKNSTASTVTKTMSMTLRSAIRVHGEESLDTNGFHQNGSGNNKESKPARKTKRWLCFLTPTTIG